MANYVGPHATQYQFEYLPEFYQKSEIGESFSQCVVSVGLAGYATVNNIPDLVHMARRKYVYAIREVNSALATLETARKDSTLVSVMLLGIFEVIMSPSQQALDTLVVHLNGAMELAKLRSKEQFKTHFGRRLFHSLSINLVVTCLLQNNTIPEDFVRLRQCMPDIDDPEKPQHRFLDYMIKWINLMRSIDSGLISTPSNIMNHCRHLDLEMQYFVEKLPPSWQCQVIFADTDPELVFEGYYFVYGGMYMAQLLNNLRLARIRLNKVIVTQAIQVLQDTTTFSVDVSQQVQISKAILLQLASEICATVPQLAGYASSQDQGLSLDPNLPTSIPVSPDTILRSSTPDRERNRIGHHFLSLWTSYASLKDRERQIGTLEYPKPAGGYHLVWPLFVVSQMTILPTEMHQWVTKRLQFITRALSPDYTEVLMNHMRSRIAGSKVAFGPDGDLAAVFGPFMSPGT